MKEEYVAQYIAMQSTLNLCEVVKRKKGSQVGMQWQEQAVIELTGERETAATMEVDDLGLEK